MMWVKETLPPRARFRWLLMTMRLSISSLAGTARTLVAVGTWRLASMLVTTRADAPRNGRTSVSSLALAAGLAAGLVAGCAAGCAAGLAAGAGVLGSAGAGLAAAGAAGAGGAGAA